MSVHLGEWQRSIGLEYEAAFRDNEIDDEVLRSLTAGDLRDLGKLWLDTNGNALSPCETNAALSRSAAY